MRLQLSKVKSSSCRIDRGIIVGLDWTDLSYDCGTIEAFVGAVAGVTVSWPVARRIAVHGRCHVLLIDVHRHRVRDMSTRVLTRGPRWQWLRDWT